MFSRPTGRGRRWPLAVGNLASGRRDSGQSLVEFALVLPILLALILGIVEFGRGFQAWLTLSNASAVGARTAAVGASAAQIEVAVRDAVPTLDQAALSVRVTNAGGPSGEAVTVTLDYALPLLTPLFTPLAPGGALSLSAHAVQRLE